MPLRLPSSAAPDARSAGVDAHGRGRAAGLSTADLPGAVPPPSAMSASACSATCRPMGMAEVAAGEGALQMWIVRAVRLIRKSCTSVPSRSTAWARTPLGCGRRSSIVSSGQ